MSVIVSILVSIVLSGCSKSAETDVIVKTNNMNQSPTASSNGSVSANNNVSANNAPSVNPPNAPTPVDESSSTIPVNKDNKSAPAVNEPKPQIGSGGGDFSLFIQARGALSSDKELSGVVIELKEGNATLTGNVSSAALKTKAGQLVQTVKGIKSVKNNLRVAL